jgi:hypothetical protein
MPRYRDKPPPIPKQFIDLALDRIDQSGFDPHKESHTYVVVARDRTYPPPAVVAFAWEAMEGKVIPVGAIRGGEGTPAFRIIREAGYKVLRKSEVLKSQNPAREERRDGGQPLDNDVSADVHQDGPFTSQLSKETALVDDDGYFDPSTLKDDRDRILREIVQRRGQPGFRKKLLDAYKGCCAITGCNAVAALEAAHISPYSGPDSNHVTNGVLLRADLHTLFDLNLIGIDPDLVVVLAENFQKSHYEDIDGHKLKIPEDAGAVPNKKALQARWDQFKAK